MRRGRDKEERDEEGAETRRRGRRWGGDKEEREGKGRR